jgi:hypothetical protein
MAHIAAVALTLLLSEARLSHLSTQTLGCSSEKAERADMNLDSLKTWTDFYQAFREFRDCDDGALAEGWADFTERMFAEHWDRLSELQRLINRDPKFAPFVVRHLGDITGYDNSFGFGRRPSCGVRGDRNRSVGPSSKRYAERTCKQIFNARRVGSWPEHCGLPGGLTIRRYVGNCEKWRSHQVATPGNSESAGCFQWRPCQTLK